MYMIVSSVSKAFERFILIQSSSDYTTKEMTPNQHCNGKTLPL